MRQPWQDKADNSMLALTLRIDPRIEIVLRPYRHRLHSHFDLRNGRQECRPYTNGLVGTPFLASAAALISIDD
jgi:hypothetical protein